MWDADLTLSGTVGDAVSFTGAAQSCVRSYRSPVIDLFVTEYNLEILYLGLQ